MLIAVSDEEAIDEMILVIIIKKSTTSNKAEPRNDARNVLKNDFIRKYNYTIRVQRYNFF